MRIGSATDGSWTPAPDERSVCSPRVHPSTTGLTASRWLGFETSVTAISPAAVAATPFGAEVVLDVARAALGVADDSRDRPLALELAQDRLVRLADRVGEHAEAAAVRHADHDLVRAAAAASSIASSSIGTSTSSPSIENCFWPRNARRRYCSNASTSDSRSSRRRFSSALERLPVAARLDRLPQPHALLVVRDVLDLVRDRAAVRLLELRQRVGERLAGDVEPEQRGGDPRLELRRQRRLEPLGLERRVADRLGAERVEARGEMAVHADRR